MSLNAREDYRLVQEQLRELEDQRAMLEADLALRQHKAWQRFMLGLDRRKGELTRELVNASSDMHNTARLQGSIRELDRLLAYREQQTTEASFESLDQKIAEREKRLQALRTSFPAEQLVGDP